MQVLETQDTKPASAKAGAGAPRRSMNHCGERLPFSVNQICFGFFTTGIERIVTQAQ